MTEPGADRAARPATPRDLARPIVVLASQVRARLLFTVLDAICVVAAYSASEVFYWRNVAPSEYGWHFGIFVLIVAIVTLVCNRIYGLYGRMWQHAGLEEARQMIFSTATVAAFLAVFSVLVRLAGFQLVHPSVVGGRPDLRDRRHEPDPFPLAHLRLAARLEGQRSPGCRRRYPRSCRDSRTRNAAPP